nr:Dihydrofolate reductase [uncultured bacterium]
MQKARLSIIAALGKNRELGKGNELIWRISPDLKRVKTLTTGHPIIMGRKTFESIGKPLPNRTNIVITRSNMCIDGVLIFDSLDKAILAARAVDEEEIFIFGGSSVYAEALPNVDRLYITRIDATDNTADVFFPDYSAFTKEIFREEHPEHNPPFTWITLER